MKTDQWTGYMPLKADYEHLKQVPSGRKGKNFPEMHRVIMQFKGWLRGIHHHAEHLQVYVNDYTYRYNRGNQKVGDLIERMVKSPPCPYRQIIG